MINITDYAPPTDAEPAPTPAQRAATLFQSHFHTTPTSIAHAPGRVNIIGDHTDYSGGCVLPMAIDRRTAVAAKLTNSGQIEIISEWDAKPDSSRTYSVPWKQARPAHFVGPGITPTWAAYAVGAAACTAQTGWLRTCGLALAIASDLPIGAGLSSSAAVEVATIAACVGLSKVKASLDRIAALAHRAEHLYAGVPCGRMDQECVTVGTPDGMLFIDYTTNKHTFITLPESCAVIIAHSGASHQLASGEYARRRALLERANLAIAAASHVKFPTLAAALAATTFPSLLARDLSEAIPLCQHVADESARVLSFIGALESEDLAAAGRLLTASHASLRDGFNISCPELDRLVELAVGLPGVYGARMTGGGFGGCIVVLCGAGHSAAVQHLLRANSPLVFAARPDSGVAIAQ